MTPGEDFGRLASAVRDRRSELDMTQVEVATAGGPSVATQQKIEAAQPSNYTPVILDRLERALRWERGSARELLAGGEAVPLRAAPEVPLAAPQPLQSRARARIRRMATIQDTAARVLHEVEQARRLNPAATAEDIFGGPDGDPDEVYIWSLEGMTEETRADHIAVLRWELAREEDERHRNRKRAG